MLDRIIGIACLLAMPHRRAVRRVLSGASVIAAMYFLIATTAGFGALSDATTARVEKASLPAGTKIYLRLETPVSTKTSHLHDAIKAHVVREVDAQGGVLIPLGAEVLGKLDKVIPSSSPSDRAKLKINFGKIEIPGKSSITLSGHVSDVENARETVQSDGTVQGVLESEVPLARIEGALGKLGTEAGEVVKAKEKTLGKADTSIEYPAGTDLTFTLDKPLNLDPVGSSAASHELPADLAAAVSHLLQDAPQRAEGKNKQPGDPLNLAFVGSRDQIVRAFQEAGWSEAEQKNANSVWETIRAVVGNQGYGRAPVSELYLYGRPEDMAFEKMLNTFLKRHHLRIWKSPVSAPDGREIWLCAATHDTGLDVRPGVMSHAIDPDLDAERAKVGADLMVTGHVAAEQLVSRPNPVTEGLTATGATWKTDGQLLVINLKPE